MAKGVRGAEGARVLMRIREFADRANIAEKTARTWVSEGRISHVRLGRSIRIPLEELNRLVSEGTRAARKSA